MPSLAVKRIIAGAIGLLFAVVYGLWTMMLTGGGHGNFIWLLLFLFVEFVGLYFPLMAILAVDLRPFLAKIFFSSLICFNLVVSSIMIIGWMTESGDNGLSDFQKMWQMGAGWILFAAFAHFLPTIIFIFLLIRSILFGSSLADDDQTFSLNLS